MGKHNRRSNSAVRKTVVLGALGASSAAVMAQPANAAEVVVPNTDIRIEVAGLENLPNIGNLPGIGDWVPSLAGQATPVNYNAVADFIPAPPANNDVGQAIVDAAASRIGAPYAWGATGPWAFDCSGLTSWAYAQVGKSIPRTSQSQAYQGTPVAYNDLRAGDIVAFYSGATHVGIYTGHGTVIHALNYGTPLSETPMNYMPFHSAVRF